MLEFAYTGEVNVAQDLLPSLLHTARCFKIKGLDKVESPVEQPMVWFQQFFPFKPLYDKPVFFYNTKNLIPVVKEEILQILSTNQSFSF